MQFRRVLDEESIRHEGERRIGTAEFRQAALLGRVVDGSKASRRPTRCGGGGGGKLINELLSVSRSAWVSRSAEYESSNRSHQ
jgi:hypothetical protein